MKFRSIVEMLNCGALLICRLNMIFIASTIWFHNCPVHDGGSPGSLVRFDGSFIEICEWLRDNMNELHPSELVIVCSFGLFPIQLRYEHGNHQYHTCWVSFKNFRKFPISILLTKDRIEIQSESEWMDWEYVEEELSLAVEDFQKNI